MKSPAVKALQEQRRELARELKGIDRALALVGGVAPKRRKKRKVKAGGNLPSMKSIVRDAGKAARKVGKAAGKRKKITVTDAELEEKRRKARELKGGGEE